MMTTGDDKMIINNTVQSSVFLLEGLVCSSTQWCSKASIVSLFLHVQLFNAHPPVQWREPPGDSAPDEPADQ